jgi:SAM-dependent methyltransferase
MIDESLAVAHCPVCGSSAGEALEPPHPSRSVTSGGIILDSPLHKLQCLECGLVRQSRLPETVKATLYRDNYALYHQRPGTLDSESARYAAMTKWILAEIAPFSPSTVLDVGCGGGLLLEALKLIHSSAHYEGIDPSVENSALARARGFLVATGFTPGTAPPRARYDLIVTANVMSHITDPLTFLRALASMTEPDGRVVIFSHDGSEPGADLLWSDVEFSFCREHIGSLASRVGLQLLNGNGTAPPRDQLDKHVLVFEPNQSPTQVLLPAAVQRDKLLEGRRQYFNAWRQLAGRLEKQTRNAPGPVLNFGASFWSMLLATYCPDYWKRVEACVVDEGTGTFFGKPVIATKTIANHSQPLIVLGVNPSNQAALTKRLSGHGVIMAWNDLITR